MAASELAANAIAHTASGSGGKFAVHLSDLGDRVAILVCDEGGPTIPSPRKAADQEESGRGLWLVASLCAEFRVIGDDHGRGVLAVISALPGAGQPCPL